MARRFPDHRIILRPHPSEIVENWHAWIGGHDRVEVMREGAAVPWILAAHMLVHTNCTTGVEAVALDTPSICLVSMDNPANRRYLANVVNPVTTNIGATIREIERVLADPQHCYSDNMIACFRDSMSFEEKRLGGETIIDHIVSAGNKRGWSEQSKAVSDWRAYSGYRWHQKDKNVRGILFPDESLRPVEARLRQYAELLSLEIHLRVQACAAR